MAKYWGCLILGVPHELHEHSEHDNSWALFAWRSMAKLLGFSPEIPDFSNWKDPPCYQWVNPLFLWVMFNSYVTNYQRVSSMSINLYSDRTSDRTILNICTCFFIITRYLQNKVSFCQPISTFVASGYYIAKPSHYIRDGYILVSIIPKKICMVMLIDPHDFEKDN